MTRLRVFNLAMLATALFCAEPGFAREPLVLDSNGNVQQFYGIPVALTRLGLKRLHFPVKKRHEQGEGDSYPVYRITADDGIQVDVTFDDHGKLYGAETTSPNAVGPKKIGIGSTLAEVKAAWPTGKLLFGFEDGYFVTYVTGTNVLLRFDPDNMPPGAFDHDRPRDFPVPDNIKVQRISVYPDPNPVPKGVDPTDPNKTWLTVIRDGEELYRLDVERTPGSPHVRLIWARRGKVELDRSVDVSQYPGFDISPMNLVRDANPIVIAFRHGDFKNCAVREDDRDLVYVTLPDTGSTISPHPPESVTYKDGPGLPKYVGNMMNSAAHGCRWTYDPKLGTFGLEKDDGTRKDAVTAR